MKINRVSGGEWIFPLILAFFALLIRCVGLDRVGFWTDEIHSLFLSEFSVLDYWANPTLTDHPPLYFIIVSFWRSASESETWIRLLSVLFGALAVFPVYWIGRTLGGRALGIWAALFLVFSPFHFRYSQEARGYSLLFLLCALFLLAALCLLERPGRIWNWLYIVFGVLVSATHNVGFLFVFCIVSMTLTVSIRAKERVASLIKLNLALFIASLPVLTLLIRQSQFKLITGFWQQPPGWYDVFAVLKTFCFTGMPTLDHLLQRLVGWNVSYLPLEPFTAAAFTVLAAISFIMVVERKQTLFLIVLTFIILHPILLIVMSWISVPVFAARTAIPALIAVPLLLGSAPAQTMETSKKKWIGALAGLCLLLSAASIYLDYKTLKKEDWRGLVQYLTTHAEPDDAILYWNYNCGLGLEYYARRSGLSNPILGLPQNYRDALLTPTITMPPKGVQGRLKQFAKGRSRIWVVHFPDADHFDKLQLYLANSEHTKESTKKFISLELDLFTSWENPLIE